MGSQCIEIENSETGELGESDYEISFEHASEFL